MWNFLSKIYWDSLNRQSNKLINDLIFWESVKEADQKQLCNSLQVYSCGVCLCVCSKERASQPHPSKKWWNWERLSAVCPQIKYSIESTEQFYTFPSHAVKYSLAQHWECLWYIVHFTKPNIISADRDTDQGDPPTLFEKGILLTVHSICATPNKKVSFSNDGKQGA